MVTQDWLWLRRWISAEGCAFAVGKFGRVRSGSVGVVTMFWDDFLVSINVMTRLVLY